MPQYYFSHLSVALKRGIQRSVAAGQEGGIQESFRFLFGQGKLFGNRKLLHSLAFSVFGDMQHVVIRPGNVFVSRSNLQLINSRRNISVLGPLYRTFSIPLASGPSFEVCGIHTENSKNSEKSVMAVIGSRAIYHDCSLNNWTSEIRQLPASANKPASCRYNGTLESCREARMCLQNKRQSNDLSIYGFFICNLIGRKDNILPGLRFGLARYYNSLSTCSSAGTASDMSFDNSLEEQLAIPGISSDGDEMAGRKLKLISGSCYLPHPDKEATGGEDAHFICTDEQAIGVADGVGGWADHGVDAGLFARELMSHSVDAIREEPKDSIDTSRVLEKAHASTRADGSSTACIVALTKQGLHAINLGDSGFVVVRDGCTVFRSPVQQHDFNFTYQLESGNSGDLPSSGVHDSCCIG
ncbi:probable protein phosphatase 2C 55 isoform X2 [Impatiens glandulifera]|uniref:probable protein phosphatase 2C 55 isoform X2 n=1 Tax=Impatiens glandulifera TaxID=253017 RepID=UPI001FB0566B|nr:probable protein phosphatase 2C 55 isoform X2 [Impatiens glandulifera]